MTKPLGVSKLEHRNNYTLYRSTSTKELFFLETEIVGSQSKYEEFNIPMDIVWVLQMTATIMSSAFVKSIMHVACG